MTSEAVLSVVDVRKAFEYPTGTLEVLTGIRLDIGAGELVTLSGRSGSGKSALIALLCGFDTPDSGTIRLGGHPFDHPLAWRSCAVVPQTFGLLGELTAQENVALPLRFGGGNEGNGPNAAGRTPDRVDELLAELGASDLADRYPAEMSFGQQQRIALARAVAARPRVLLADEPTAHLDRDTSPAVRGTLRRCADSGTAVLIATHDPALSTIADRRLRLVDGHVVNADAAP